MCVVRSGWDYHSYSLIAVFSLQVNASTPNMASQTQVFRHTLPHQSTTNTRVCKKCPIRWSVRVLDVTGGPETQARPTPLRASSVTHPPASTDDLRTQHGCYTCCRLTSVLSPFLGKAKAVLNLSADSTSRLLWRPQMSKLRQSTSCLPTLVGRVNPRLSDVTQFSRPLSY